MSILLSRLGMHVTSQLRSLYSIGYHQNQKQDMFFYWVYRFILPNSYESKPLVRK